MGPAGTGHGGGLTNFVKQKNWSYQLFSNEKVVIPIKKGFASGKTKVLC